MNCNFKRTEHVETLKAKILKSFGIIDKKRLFLNKIRLCIWYLTYSS